LSKTQQQQKQTVM